MHSPLIQSILHEQHIVYLIVGKNFVVHEWGGELDILSDDHTAIDDLFTLVPELVGCEEVLQEILEESLPRFQLDNLNRVTPQGEIRYLNLTVSPYLSKAEEILYLLITITDITVLSQVHQVLMQQRNELSLLKKSLVDTNQRLEFILERYVPREVGKALMENRILPELGGDVRKITALFADLRNYTSMSEKLAPTEMIEMLHICLDIASTAITEAGGVIVNFMGDAVMAIFNAPDEQADHAHRAVRAALNLQFLMNQHQQTTVDNKPLLYFGVGINTGPALVGNIGAQWHYQYTAVGDTINVASRICSHAQPREILMGENTYAHLEGQVVAQALPPVQFKGKSESSTVYRVLELIK